MDRLRRSPRRSPQKASSRRMSMPIAQPNKENNGTKEVPRPSRLSLAPSRGILKSSIYEENNTVIGVMNFNNEDSTEVLKKRRVSFAQNATVWNTNVIASSRAPAKITQISTPPKLKKDSQNLSSPIRQSPRLKKLREEREQELRRQSLQEDNESEDEDMELTGIGEEQHNISSERYNDEDMEFTEIGKDRQAKNDDMLISFDSPVRSSKKSMAVDDGNETMELTSVFGGISAAGAPHISSQVRDDIAEKTVARPISSLTGKASPLSADNTMEMTGLVGKINDSVSHLDNTMEFTNPLGRIFNGPPPDLGDEKLRQSDGNDTTMEMTKPVGQILKEYPSTKVTSQIISHLNGSDTTMEMTKPVGQILKENPSINVTSRDIAQFNDNDTTMEMTKPLGRIFEGTTSSLGSQKLSQLEDNDTTMEMTKPVGQIIERPIKSMTGQRLFQLDTNDSAMEMTSSLGKIFDDRIVVSNKPNSMETTSMIGKMDNTNSISDEEDVSMDITAAIEPHDQVHQIQANNKNPNDAIMDNTTFLNHRLHSLRTPKTEPRLRTPQKQLIHQILPAPTTSHITRAKIMSMSPRKSIRSTPEKKSSNGSIKSSTTLLSDFSVSRLTPRNVFRQSKTPLRKSSASGDRDRNVMLKEFLSMISIDFMNEFLSNTRGHSSFGIINEPVDDPILADYVVGFQKLLHYDMYKHGSNQLRENIDIESAFYSQWEEDTLKETPILFQEYLDASEETKKIMNAQFKLLKSYAREKAKGDWYHWRHQLTESLCRALDEQKSKLLHDQNIVTEKGTTLYSYLDNLHERKKVLLTYLDNSHKKLASMKTYNKSEITNLHSRLSQQKKLIHETKQNLDSKKKDLAETKNKIDEYSSKKLNLQSSISQCERSLHEESNFNNDDLKKLESMSQWVSLCSGIHSLEVRQSNSFQYVFLDTLRVKATFQQNTKIETELFNTSNSFLKYCFNALDYNSVAPLLDQLELLHKQWYAVTRMKLQLDMLRLQFILQESLNPESFVINLDLLVENASPPTKVKIQFEVAKNLEIKSILVDMVYGSSQYLPSEGKLRLLERSVEKYGLVGLTREYQQIFTA